MATLICNTRNFSGFTYGKKYTGELNHSIFCTINDLGLEQYPTITGTLLGGGDYRKIYYFLTIDQWREKRLKEFFNEEQGK